MAVPHPSKNPLRGFLFGFPHLGHVIAASLMVSLQALHLVICGMARI